jgi:hypothetical protein
MVATGVPGLQANDQRRGEVPIEVGLAGGQRLLDPFGALFLDVVHVGEPLLPEELFGHVLGVLTDAGHLDQPEPRGLGRRLRGNRPGVQAEQPHWAREG